MSDDTDIATMLAARKPDEPVYALRPHAIRAAAELFTTSFPGEVLYAVKANPDPLVLEALYAGGIRQFDVASLEEIRLVKERFPAVQCFFMHPVKAVTALREAANTYGITHFAVDHPDELAKIIVHTAPKKPTVVVRLALPHALAVPAPRGAARAI